MALGSTLTEISAIKSGVPVKIVADLAVGYPQQITVSKSFMSAHHLAASSPLSAKVAALQDARLAGLAPGDSNSQLYDYLLERYGLKALGSIAALSSPASALAALKKGRVDVIATSPPAGQEAVAANCLAACSRG